MKVLTIFLLFTLAACGKNDSESELAELARSEGKGAIEAQNQDLDQKRGQIEADLLRRYNVITALSGTFRGKIEVDNEISDIRLSLFPSQPLIQTNRFRSLEELVSDWNHLGINAQIVQGEPNSPLNTTSCAISGVKPDYEKGSIYLFSEDCPNVYYLEFSWSPAMETTDMIKGSQLISSLYTGSLKNIKFLTGYIYFGGAFGSTPLELTKEGITNEN